MRQHGSSCISVQSVHWLLKKYIQTKDIEAGRRLYAQDQDAGVQSNTFLGSFFIRLFAFGENPTESELVFNRLPQPDVFSWTAIISAFNQHGMPGKALQMYYTMLQRNVWPDGHALVAILHSCSMSACLPQGKCIHSQIHGSRAEQDVFVANGLIDMYGKCGHVEGALRVFNGLKLRDAVSWNAVIGSFIKQGLNKEAASFFIDMQTQNLKPTRATFVTILKGCSCVEFVELGKLVHSQMVEEGLEAGLITGSSLTNMYAKSGMFVDACCVLEKQPSRHIGIWNALITGFVQHGDGEKALEMFRKMKCDGFDPNEVTLVCILKACTGMCDFESGKQIHMLILDDGLEQNSYIGNALIELYTAMGSLKDARRVFDRALRKDHITWTAIVTGYAQHGCGNDALYLFQQMQQEGVEADLFTYVYILKACTGTLFLDQGMLIHYIIIETGILVDTCLGSTLIDFYAKCGSIGDAITIFIHLPKHNIVTWSAMMAAYSLHGQHKSAIRLFEDMKRQGLTPDDITFISLLSTCAQFGLVSEGKELFEAIRKDFDLVPKSDHYNCLVDMLGRVGFLAEAESMMELSPSETSFIGWMTLLSHCKAHNRVEIARRCFDHIVALDSGHGSAYVMMSDIYTNAGMLEDAEKIRKMRSRSQAWKKPGQAAIEINSRMHAFVVGDESHSQKFDIYLKLNNLNFQLLVEGYVPYATMPL